MNQFITYQQFEDMFLPCGGSADEVLEAQRSAYDAGFTIIQPPIQELTPEGTGWHPVPSGPGRPAYNPG